MGCRLDFIIDGPLLFARVFIPPRGSFLASTGEAGSLSFCPKAAALIREAVNMQPLVGPILTEEPLRSGLLPFALENDVRDPV
jgi:hypothetical protein